jgi:A/G-specific adenine glycosylase
MTFAHELLTWYPNNKRDLPWRDIDNPYFIWLSEVILQQTKVAQGMPYYLRFVENYPTIGAMAAAEEKDILRLWQGLGYYSRARNMHQTAQIIVNEYDSNFPNTYKTLKKLKGIGDYTASAIASFAFGEKVAVLDGNVFRVLARVFGVEEDIMSTKGKKVFAELAKNLLPNQQTNTYNQAIMEFGALYCKPSSPDCPNCILRDSCVAFASKKQDILPIKAKKTVAKKRYLHYLVFEFENKLLLKERNAGDVWQGLYDFVLVEKDSEKKILPKNTGKKTAQTNTNDTKNTTEITENTAINNEINVEINTNTENTYSLTTMLDTQIKELPLLILGGTQAIQVEGFAKEIIFVKESPTYLHQLTHQTMYVTFSHLLIQEAAFAEAIATENQATFYTNTEIYDLPKPILIDNYWKEYFAKS